MNAHNTQTNYMATSHAQSSTYATPAEEPESCANTGYFLSLRGLLKLACLVSAFYIIRRNRIPQFRCLFIAATYQF